MEAIMDTLPPGRAMDKAKDHVRGLLARKS